MEGFKTEDQILEAQANGEDTNAHFDADFNFMDNNNEEDVDMSEFQTQDFTAFIPAAPANDDGKLDNPDDNKPKGLFDDELEEVEEEGDINVEAFNKQMGTDFKTIQELRDSFAKGENPVDVRADEEKTIQVNTNTIGIYESYLAKDDREIIKLDLISNYKRDKKDINDPDILAEIEDKLDAIEGMNDTNRNASLLRFQIKNEINRLNAEAGNLKQKWQKHDENLAAENQKKVQDFFIGVQAKGDFYGIVPDPKVLKQVYADITSDKFYKEVNSSPEELAELALMRHYKAEIAKNATRPTHSDGIKTVFDQANGKQNQRSITQARNSSGGNDNTTNLIKDFIA